MVRSRSSKHSLLPVTVRPLGCETLFAGDRVSAITLPAMSQSKRLLQQERAAETRRQILRAAERVFVRRGFAAASVQAIADEGSVSQGAVFFHFGSKEALLLAVAEANAREIFHLFDRLLEWAQGRDAVALLVDGQRRLGHVADGGEKLHFALLSEALRPQEPLNPAYAQYYEAFRRLGERWLEAQIAAGHVRADLDARSVMTAVLAGFMGIQLQKELDPRAVDLDAVYEALGSILAAGLALT